MRWKVVCAGDTAASALAAYLVMQSDLAELVVTSGPQTIATLIDAATAQGLEPRVRGGDDRDLSGADVVVVDSAEHATLEALADRAGGAIIVVMSVDAPAATAAVLKATRLPGGRVLGVLHGPGDLARAAGAAALVDAVLRDRCRPIRCAVGVPQQGDGLPDVELREVLVGANGAEALGSSF